MDGNEKHHLPDCQWRDRSHRLYAGGDRSFPASARRQVNESRSSIVHPAFWILTLHDIPSSVERPLIVTRTETLL